MQCKGKCRTASARGKWDEMKFWKSRGLSSGTKCRVTRPWNAQRSARARKAPVAARAAGAGLARAGSRPCQLQAQTAHFLRGQSAQAALTGRWGCTHLQHRGLWHTRAVRQHAGSIWYIHFLY